MTRCPDGHESAATDYCDICGAPMDAAPAMPPAAPGPGHEAPSSQRMDPPHGDAPESADAVVTQACPHCGAINPEDNLFCEVCGFDFTTGVMPRVEGGEPSFLDLPEPLAQEVPDAPSTPDRPPALPAPHDDEAPSVDGAEVPAGGVEAPAGGIEAPAEPEDEAEVASAPAEPSRRPVNRPPSRAVAGDWVVEVWIDPDWYAEQDTEEACPSPAPPEVVALVGSDALIGRRSRSSVPDVDCGIDSAVSRRQALLTSDGRRWWIEDLDSSNGTWIGPAIGPLPSSPVTGRTEVDADDRIYVGAWTRLVVRPATDGEVGDRPGVR